MNQEVSDLLLANYTFQNIEIISENTTGVNKVYIISLKNDQKYVAKLYTQDNIPDAKIFDAIDSISSNNCFIPCIIKNKDGLIVSRTKDNIPLIVSTFLAGKMLDDDIVDFEFCRDIINVLLGIQKIDATSFKTDFGYKKIIIENDMVLEIKIDLAKCKMSLIHVDLNHMNILTNNGQLSGILDWDGLHKDYLVTDLAILTTHNLLETQTKDLFIEFIDYAKVQMQLSFKDVALYYELIPIRIKQILNMLKKKSQDVPQDNVILNKYIALKKKKLDLLN